jgi:murein DD-endopeptidase MepM/ murein hydrolase activator NlpD
LLVPSGTKVLAVQNGAILWIYEFFNGTWAMEVQHDEFIARYCEISPHNPAGIIEGKTVSEGDVIATVGAQAGGSMLHFEMFQDKNRKSSRVECYADSKACLTNKSHATQYTNVPQANYERRDDLLDPTPYLDAWSIDLRKKLHREMDLSFDVGD